MSTCCHCNVHWWQSEESHKNPAKNQLPAITSEWQVGILRPASDILIRLQVAYFHEYKGQADRIVSCAFIAYPWPNKSGKLSSRTYIVKHTEGKLVSRKSSFWWGFKIVHIDGQKLFTDFVHSLRSGDPSPQHLGQKLPWKRLTRQIPLFWLNGRTH